MEGEKYSSSPIIVRCYQTLELYVFKLVLVSGANDEKKRDNEDVSIRQNLSDFYTFIRIHITR